MNPSTFSIQIGAIRCTALLDGMSDRDASGTAQLFPTVPKKSFLDAVAAYYSGDRPFRWAYSPLLIETAGQTILVDTGNGARAKPDNGYLLDSLAIAGISPHQIDLVLISHAHGDHINGLLDENKALIYSNARYLFDRVEWEYWRGPDGAASRGEAYRTYLANTLDSLKDRLTLLDGETTFAPGVRTVSAPGHTPGHVGLLIESGGERLLDLVDTLHTEIQLLHPEWSPRFDSQPALSPVTRRKMLAWAADEALLTRFYHLPFPGLGRVRREGDAFRWEPVGSA